MFKWSMALMTLILAAALGSGTATAADYNLKMQTYYSPTTAMGAQFFADQVKKLTDGKVDVQVFTGGELVGSGNILKSVRNGMIDIGHGMGHHFTERKSGQLESGLPMSWMSPVEADVIYERRGLKKLVGDDYEKLGVVYLGPTWAAPYTILSKEPIRSLDDMRKMKIRAVGASAKMLTQLGVNVVSMPPEDIYMALTTGQIDGVVYGSPAEYKENKFYEAAPWINVTPLIDPITDTLIINKKTWEKMPEQIRAAILAAADETRWAYYIWSADESLKALKEVFKDKITTFPAEDQKELVKAAEKIWEEEAQKSDDAKAGVEVLKDFARSSGRL